MPRIVGEPAGHRERAPSRAVVTRTEEYLGNIPKVFALTRASASFWATAVPSLLAQPVAQAFMAGHLAPRYLELINEIPWWAPGLAVAALWLIGADVVRWHRMVSTSRRPLRLVLGQCDTCVTFDMHGRVQSVRLGVWNAGPGTAMVDLYIQSLRTIPPIPHLGFNTRLKIAEVNSAGLEFERQTRINQHDSALGHHHFEFLLWHPANDSYKLLVRQEISLFAPTKYVASLSIEATDMPSTVVEIDIDPATTPPISLRAGRLSRWLARARGSSLRDP